VKLPVGENFSQAIVLHVFSDAWTTTLVYVPSEIDSVMAAGAAPPWAAVNVKLDALTVKPCGCTGAATVSVTFAVWVVEPEVTVIVPLQVVPAAMPVVSTETVKTLAVGPAVKVPVGEMVTQFAAVQVCFET
jgi:hypothetical protein